MRRRSSSSTNPACGVTTFEQAQAVAPAQSPRIISPDFRNPYTWQSSIGFQKQINQVTGFDVDLTHFNEYRDTRTIDPNLFYNPATGYNQSPAAVNGVANRPNPAYTQIAYFVSTGHRDQTQLSMALNRRFKNNFQSGVTYTYMLSMHDDGNIGYTAPGQNNPFDYLDGEYATSTDYQQQHAAPLGALSLPVGHLGQRVVLLRLGEPVRGGIAAAVYGKPGHQPSESDRRRRRDQPDRHPGHGDAGQRRRHRDRQPVPRTVDDQFRRHDSAQRAARGCRCTRWICG